MDDMFLDDDEVVKVYLDIVFFMQGRNDPIFAVNTFRFVPIDLPKDIEQLTDAATADIRFKINQRDAIWLLLEDEQYNKTMVKVEDIQGFKVHAPAVFPEALAILVEAEEDDGE